MTSRPTQVMDMVTTTAMAAVENTVSCQNTRMPRLSARAGWTAESISWLKDSEPQGDHQGQEDQGQQADLRGLHADRMSPMSSVVELGEGSARPGWTEEDAQGHGGGGEDADGRVAGHVRSAGAPG